MCSTFSALHWMQGGLNHERNVRPSVRRSICQTRALWQSRTFCQIFIRYERSFSLVFREKEWLVGATPSTWNFGSTDPVGAKLPISSRYSLVAPQALHLAKRFINTNTNFTTHFLSNEFKVNIPPSPGAQKRNTAVFRVKSYFAWRKSATKFLRVKTVSVKVVRHSFAYLTEYKWLVRTSPSMQKFGGYWPTPCKTPIFNLFSL